MKIISQLHRLKKIHLLVEQGKTGTPKELAKKLHVSERCLYNCLDVLKTWKAPLVYDKKNKIYYYASFFNFEILVSVKVMTKDETVQINAGHIFSKKERLLQGLCSVQA